MECIHLLGAILSGSEVYAHIVKLIAYLSLSFSLSPPPSLSLSPPSLSLSLSLLSLLFQTNAQLAVLSVSDTFLYTLLEPRESCSPLQVLTVRVTIRMIHVIHCWVPEEVSTLYCYRFCAIIISRLIF